MTGSIAHICYFDPDTYPGVYHSANILVESGWQVDVVSLDLYGFGAKAFDPRVRVERLPTIPGAHSSARRARFLSFVRMVRRIGKERRWRYVVGHDMLGFVAARLARVVPPDCVAFWSQDLAEPTLHTFTKRLVYGVKKHCLRDCPLTIAPSVTRAAALASLYHIPSTPLVVYNAPRLATSAVDDGWRQRLDLRQSDVVGVYAGGLGCLRLVPELIQSAAKWPPHARLVIAGYGTPAEIAHVQRMIQESAVGDRVRFAGHLSSALGLIKAGDFGISLFQTECSRRNFMHRGLASNKIFECLAMGRPIVVSRNQETEHFVRKHECGVSVGGTTPESIAAAVRELIASPAALLGMQRRAEQVHRTETHFENRFAIIQQILATGDLSWRPLDAVADEG